MALSSTEIQERLRSGELTIGEAVEYAKANTSPFGEKGKKSSAHSSIDALANSLRSGEDPTGLTLESKYSEFNSDEILRNLGGATDKSEANRLRNLQVIENTLRSSIRNAGVLNEYPLLVGGKDTDSRVKELGLQTQKRNKKPTQALVPSEDVDRIYFGTKDNPGGALANVTDAPTRGFLIYQRYTGARIESTIDKNFGLKASDITFRKGKNGERIATIKSVTFGKKTRPAVQYEGAFAEFLYSEAQRAKKSGHTNLFETSKSKTDKAWNTHFKPKFEEEFLDALPIDPRTKKPSATPSYPRKMAATILEEEVGAPKDLVNDWMGHVDGSTRAQSYTGGRGSKIEVGRLVDGMVRDSTRMYGVDNTNLFFVTQNVDIVDPLKDYPALDSSYGFSTNPYEIPFLVEARTPLSDEEIEQQKQTNLQELKRREAVAKTGTIDEQIKQAQAEGLLLQEQIKNAQLIKDNPELQELLEQNARNKRRLQLLEKGIDPDEAEAEAPQLTFDEDTKGRAKSMMERLKRLGTTTVRALGPLAGPAGVAATTVGAATLSKDIQADYERGRGILGTSPDTSAAIRTAKFGLEETPLGIPMAVAEATAGATVEEGTRRLEESTTQSQEELMRSFGEFGSKVRGY